MNDVENVELRLLLEGIYSRWGYDFRQYAEASIKRRIKKLLREENIETISELQSVILRDEKAFRRLLFTFSVHVSDMFRDPVFFLEFRNKIVPLLQTYPKISIWHAGCAGGEEVYSMAILLKEEGLYHKSTIYATDFNEEVVHQAKRGIYSSERMRDYTLNYQQAGGKESFGDYYTAEYGHAKIDESLKEKIVFFVHNLVTDRAFGEMNVIICRNVLIYFKRELQERVTDLLYNSLGRKGTLCLGMKETLDFTGHSDTFECCSKQGNIYQLRNGKK
jgi:chemotaxis protein methyltransferase CheR